MSRIKYAQIHIGDFLSGCIEMDATEGGAFFFLIMAHYQRGEVGIEDDDARLARICHCSLKVWKRIKDRVLEKFYLENGYWKNERVIEECRKVAQKVPKSCPKGSQVESQVTEIKENTPDITSNQKPVTNNKKNTTYSKKPHRLPDDWVCDEKLGQWAMEQGLARGEVVQEIEQFKDHYRAATGKGSTALDWDAKFRTWIRNTIKWKK